MHTAIRTDAAGVAEPGDPNALAHGQAFYAGSDGIDPSDDLVTWYDRHERVWQFAVNDVQICSTDTAGCDLDAYLPWPGLPISQFGPLERGPELVENHSLHDSKSLLCCEKSLAQALH
jgi:hypothetical protein